HAKNTAKIDFLFMTDHSNMFDNATNADDYDEVKKEFSEKSDSDWYRTRLAAEASTDKNFYAGRAFEMTYANNQAHYGHVNVYFTDTYVEASRTMATFGDFYKWLAANQDTAIACFNHPNRPDTSFNSLAYDSRVDDVIQLIEVGNGSLGANYVDTEEYYYKALDYGWHLAPVQAQDNHAQNWGNAGNLTGILAASLSKEDLLDAFKNRRLYASQSKDLRLIVKANGYDMGSILPVSVKTIDFEIKANDAELPISEIQIITNSGRILNSRKFSTAVSNAEWNVSIDPQPGAWYTVKVIHSNGRYGLGSAVYVPSGETDVRLVGISVVPAIPTVGADVIIKAQLHNIGVMDVDRSFTVTFNAGETPLGNIVVEGGIQAGDQKEITFQWTPSAKGDITISARLAAVHGVTTITDVSKQVSVIASNGIRVLVDSDHRNIGEYNGTMLRLVTLLRIGGYDVSYRQSTDATIYRTFTPNFLNGFDVIILNASSSVANSLNDDERTALANWLSAGGGLLYTSSGYRFLATGTNINGYNAASIGNPILETLGTDIRLNYDLVCDEDPANQDNNQPHSIYARSFPPCADSINTNMESLRIYLGASLIAENGQGSHSALVSSHSKKLEVLAAANPTSYNRSVKDDTAYPSGTNQALFTYQTGNSIPLVARQEINKGKIVVSGRYAFSNVEIGNDASNAAFFMSMVDYLAGINRSLAAGEIESGIISGKIVEGDMVYVRGIVTNVLSDDNSMFKLDIGKEILVSGGSSGAQPPLRAGTELMVAGKIRPTGNAFEIVFEDFDFQVLYIGKSK
ncbi:MAG: hypothetical protein LBH03_05875, partial [Holophagales bacterium]|nr:hypothetical protein [Holophagales bacterium]